MPDDEQLSLFTKRKARKAPAAKEFAIHCMIADTLRLNCQAGWLWWHTPNGELRSKATAGRLKRMGVKPGVADFLLLSPQGRLHALEVKRKGEKLNEGQVAFLDAVEDAGGVADWTDDFGHAIGILNRWGAIRVTL